MERFRIGNATLVLKQGDITLEDTDAIVNAANSSLTGGGGVDGAIHRAGGTTILDECKAIRRERGELPTGEAALTTGGNLKATYVIHTVGPVWHGGAREEEQLLGSAYRNSLLIAEQYHIRSIAFPCISTGIYGFPIERASRIAFKTVSDFLRAQQHQLKEVRFIMFSENDYAVYQPLFTSSKCVTFYNTFGSPS